MSQEDSHLARSKSLPVEHQIASSDEEDNCSDEHNVSNVSVNILPPINTNENPVICRKISFITNIESTDFRSNDMRNILCTVTPGLGVFLTTSSRHTPHIFERVLTNIHSVDISMRLQTTNRTILVLVSSSSHFS